MIKIQSISTITPLRRPITFRQSFRAIKIRTNQIHRNERTFYSAKNLNKGLWNTVHVNIAREMKCRHREILHKTQLHTYGMAVNCNTAHKHTHYAQSYILYVAEIDAVETDLR